MEIRDNFSQWRAVSSFDGFFIDKNALDRVQSTLQGGWSSYVEKVKIVTRESCGGGGKSTAGRGGWLGMSAEALVVCQVWHGVKWSVGYLSPLQMRLKEEIFIMKRKD